MNFLFSPLRKIPIDKSEEVCKFEMKYIIDIDVCPPVTGRREAIAGRGGQSDGEQGGRRGRGGTAARTGEIQKDAGPESDR